jgi:short-chain fatty acids transporter
MAFADRLLGALRAVLPSPFAIAVVLTVVTFLLAFTLTGGDQTAVDRAAELLGHWEHGLWNPPLLVFTVQMMLILVLGHVIALSRPVERIIRLALTTCRDTASAAATVAVWTLVVSLFNWGLGVVFGAIFALRVAEHAVRNNTGLNYGLVGAAGYAGMMVWHGGISGSAPIKAAEAGHLRTLMTGLMPGDRIAALPDHLGFEHTVFALANLLCAAALLVLVPAVLWWMGRRDRSPVPHLPGSTLHHAPLPPAVGAEHLDRSHAAAWTFGGPSSSTARGPHGRVSARRASPSSHRTASTCCCSAWASCCTDRSPVSSPRWTKPSPLPPVSWCNSPSTSASWASCADPGWCSSSARASWPTPRLPPSPCSPSSVPPW